MARTQPGIVGFLTTVDHKRIGMRYIYTAFVFFFASGIVALVMRLQLAGPDMGVLGPEAYNEFFTMHGTTMIFLFNTPVLAGFGNYLLPMQIGHPRHGVPAAERVQLLDLPVLRGLHLRELPDRRAAERRAGSRTRRSPSQVYSAGANLDFWGLGVIFVGISTTVGAVNFLVTTFKMRAPGMTLNRLPVFVWSMVVFSFMVIFSVPVVTTAAGLLELDRLFGTQFYVPALGGSTLLYQHLFWFWGHPEVYILFVPAQGMISMIVPVFSRRPLAGYAWVVTSLVSIGFISFGVWVHHMFATGIPPLAMSFFSAVGFVITIPSGIQFFAWIATMWRGTVKLRTPMLFALGFMLIFLIGGITGVMVSVLPFDWQVTDSYFVVAHFHYVLNGAVVFPIFGALYFWMPKMTGRMLSEQTRRDQLLDDVRRVQPGVLPDAHPRVPRDATPDLHLPRRTRMGLAESARDRRVVRVRVRRSAHPLQLRAQPGVTGSRRHQIRGGATRSSGSRPRRRPTTTSPRSLSSRVDIRSGTRIRCRSPPPAPPRRRGRSGERARRSEGDAPHERLAGRTRRHHGDPRRDVPPRRPRGGDRGAVHRSARAGAAHRDRRRACSRGSACFAGPGARRNRHERDARAAVAHTPRTISVHPPPPAATRRVTAGASGAWR